MSPLAEIIERVSVARRDTSLVLVGIGGHGASGKSTLARLIAEHVPNTQVVATDSFWNGSQFELDRLRADVVDVLLAGQTATYDEWDWAAKQLRPGRGVTPDGVVIIEGVCALHQMFRDDLAVRVWIDTPYDVRLARGVERDGETSRDTWMQVWMPNEAAYVRRDDPITCAHVIVDGTSPYG
jgi:uridine kinase